jgi:hypothetical protein
LSVASRGVEQPLAAYQLTDRAENLAYLLPSLNRFLRVASVRRTFWPVFGGCGSAVLAGAFPSFGIGFVGVSLAFGLTVVTGAYAFGPISVDISTLLYQSACGQAAAFPAAFFCLTSLLKS